MHFNSYTKCHNIGLAKCLKFDKYQQRQGMQKPQTERKEEFRLIQCQIVVVHLTVDILQRHY